MVATSDRGATEHPNKTGGRWSGSQPRASSAHDRPGRLPGLFCVWAPDTKTDKNRPLNRQSAGILRRRMATPADIFRVTALARLRELEAERRARMRDPELAPTDGPFDEVWEEAQSAGSMARPPETAIASQPEG